MRPYSVFDWIIDKWSMLECAASEYLKWVLPLDEGLHGSQTLAVAGDGYGSGKIS
jgi:hypothetical protein